MVGSDVVNPVGQGDALGLGGEVVVVHQDGLFFPGGTGVLQVPDQLPVLAVDAHDRQARLGEGLTHGCDVDELGVTAGGFAG